MAGHQQQINPYATDPTSMAGSFFHQGANAFAQPAQYHNYAPMGPHRENLLPYQRASHDFFIPDKLREELQRKAEASLQTLPNSTLPVTVDHFHSLVPLDTNNQRNTTTFGYVTWAYKATSGKDGKLYALRRLEGYRLTNEKAILAVRPWKRINNGSVVSIHEAFTTRDFGDSSLIFVTDYHPNSKTLTETHLHHNPNPRFQSRAQPQAVSEAVLWSYLVQTASALKAIHSSGLAAQVISPSKVLLTSKNRIRLNGCGIVDLVKCDALPPVEEQQQDDFLQLGRLVLCIASNANATLNMPKALDHLTRHYSPRLKDAVTWLLHPPNTPANPHPEKNIDIFLTGIASEVTTVLDNTFHAEDTLYSMLMGELENGRLVRLMAKLGLINERPEYEHNEQWSETGERYYLKLFRDYVFHAVDENGRPVVDLGHIITCLNKLDAGSAELINLVSRDEQTSLIISYKELKKGIETAFNELVRGAARRG
ncbi:hypothetical protein EJ06DRAFT_534411 [Trichodelitschia bisporula]|uniref:PAN2-PAN3 deadenylation complex subunit PAN3 n=1 Tax=Trichodelitschia bisporula TaxID=703511 RepID=A0A6G1HIY3_9PEZI|nr:hypothetical protein EJ06DRAFT_534411 [Trichodelitschia bisporula]